MNDDFTKEEEQDVGFDPKKIKEALIGDDEVLDDDSPLENEESEEDYTFDGDTDSDEDY